LNILLVEVATESGLVGWGEAFSYGCMAAVKMLVDRTLAPFLAGQDASDVAGLSYRMQRSMHLFGRYGITTFGISGVDIALWDIAGKAAGLPLRRLLGGPAEVAPLPGYASLLKYRDPELVAKFAKEAVASGYPAIKLHETGFEEACAAREILGPEVPICLDTNCPWTPRQAHEEARRLAELDLHWLEEPIFPPEDFRALARLRRAGKLPLAAGENACTAFQFQQMFEAGAVDFAQPSVTKVGGVSEFLKICTLAETHDVTVVPHCPYFGPGWLATLQVLSAMPHPGWVERFYTKLEATLYPGFTDPDRQGRFGVPDGPGLGMEPDPGVIAHYAVDPCA